jgi:hypothetical protein
MLKIKTRLIINSKLNELKMNLENNYKDLAHAALRDYLVILEQLKADNMINDKDYAKYKKIGEDYKAQMADYHH